MATPFFRMNMRYQRFFNEYESDDGNLQYTQEMQSYEDMMRKISEGVGAIIYIVDVSKHVQISITSFGQRRRFFLFSR